jgi:para-nitrobenzyl esterase
MPPQYGAAPFQLAPPERPLLGTDPPQELADAMHAAWVSFAATGNPGWPRYNRDTRSTMLFNTESRLLQDPRAWERELWKDVR